MQQPRSVLVAMALLLMGLCECAGGEIFRLPLDGWSIVAWSAGSGTGEAVFDLRVE